jgi:hypothetical protein
MEDIYNEKTTVTSFVVAYAERVFKKRINDFQGGYTTALVPGRVDQLVISDQTGPFFIEDGLASPVFTDRFIQSLPKPGDALIVEITNHNGKEKVYRWGYNCFWEASLKRIAARPQFRVMSIENFLGKPLPGKNKFKLTYTGCLQALTAECSRDGMHISRTDRFAPTYVAGPITVTNRFEKLVGAQWVPCEDPRPFPFGQQFRLMYNNKGSIGILSEGTALKINWEYPRGTNDPLAKIGNGADQFIYWERHCPGSANVYCESEWTEVADPRPLPTIPTKSVAMAKKDNKPFAVTVNSLDELDSLIPVLAKSRK